MKYQVDFVKRVSVAVHADDEEEAVEKAVNLLNKPNADGSTWDSDEMENVTPME